METVIHQLVPSETKEGWTGTVQIRGEGFDADSFSFFGGFDPRTTFVSPTRMDVAITADITKNADVLSVKVHTGEGNLSNEVPFTVTR